MNCSHSLLDLADMEHREQASNEEITDEREGGERGRRGEDSCRSIGKYEPREAEDHETHEDQREGEHGEFHESRTVHGVCRRHVPCAIEPIGFTTADAT